MKAVSYGIGSELEEIWNMLSHAHRELWVGMGLALTGNAEELGCEGDSTEDVYLKTSEVKARYGLTPYALKKARENGKIKGRIPWGQKRGWCYSVAEIERYLDECDRHALSLSARLARDVSLVTSER